MALIGFYIDLLVPSVDEARGVQALQLVRIFRLLQLARLERSSHAFSHLGRVARRKAHELLVTLYAFIVALLLCGTMLWLVEHSSQPHDVGSPLDALWFASYFVTGLGYEDIVPVTTQGKVIAGFFAFACIGLMQLPVSLFLSLHSRVPSLQIDTPVSSSRLPFSLKASYRQ